MHFDYCSRFLNFYILPSNTRQHWAVFIFTSLHLILVKRVSSLSNWSFSTLTGTAGSFLQHLGCMNSMLVLGSFVVNIMSLHFLDQILWNGIIRVAWLCCRDDTELTLRKNATKFFFKIIQIVTPFFNLMVFGLKVLDQGADGVVNVLEVRLKRRELSWLDQVFITFCKLEGSIFICIAQSFRLEVISVHRLNVFVCPEWCHWVFFLNLWLNLNRNKEANAVWMAFQDLSALNRV